MLPFRCLSASLSQFSIAGLSIRRGGVMSLEGDFCTLLFSILCLGSSALSATLSLCRKLGVATCQGSSLFSMLV